MQAELNKLMAGILRAQKFGVVKAQQLDLVAFRKSGDFKVYGLLRKGQLASLTVVCLLTQEIWRSTHQAGV